MQFTNGLTRILVLLLAAMGIQAQAIAATFNVTDATGLRSALLTAATNGQDDVIVLTAGTYATGGATFTFVTNETNTLTLQGKNTVIEHYKWFRDEGIGFYAYPSP